VEGRVFDLGSTGCEAVNSPNPSRRRLPDFIVIGAMKCATTTLHVQLARQARVWMSRPKEPNFFSDDENFARGVDWYASCFAGAGEGHLVGESSTHYTKLPHYPHTVDRMVRVLPHIKLVYLMRHPIDRLTSHYLHEVTVGRIAVGLEEAIDQYPELVDYGRYSMQLAPYLRTYGPRQVLPVFFDRLVRRPQDELERIGRFLCLRDSLRWDHAVKPQNVGRERLRKSNLRESLVRVPALTALRRRVIPRRWIERLKSLWRVDMDPPPVPPQLAGKLRDLFDPDLAQLGRWLGLSLDTDSFHEQALKPLPQWGQSALKPVGSPLSSSPRA
jgi:hypothetical protein